MALFTLGGRAVLSGEVVLPAYGAWHAELVVDSKQALTGRATLTTPGLTLVGTIDPDRSGVFQETARVTLRPGAGGLWGPVSPKFYRDVPVSVALADLLASAGETLSTTAQAAPLARRLASWTRPDGRVIDALEALVGVQAGAHWRSLEDGTVWVGEHAWAETTFAHQLVDDNRLDGRMTVASETPKLRPGVTFRGQRVQEVRILIGPGSVRTVARYAESFGQAFVRAATAATATGRDPYWYAGTVVRQLSDGTLDIKPDDTTHAPAMGWTGVRIRSGLPGTRSTVSAGQRVRVGYENGDRSKPVAALWDEGDTVTSISVGGGTAAVARVGDTADAGVLIASTVGGAVRLLSYLDGTTSSAVRDAAYAAAAAAAAALGGAAQRIDLVASITSGTDKLKA